MQRQKLIAIATIVIIVVVLLVAFGVLNQHFYLFQKVEQHELGVKMRGGKIIDIVEPGVYSDFGWYAQLLTVSGQSVELKAEDLELITRDSQIIGLLVTGDIFRPQYADRSVLKENWVEYRVFYLEDEALQTRINSFTFQAMKVCVGERTFDDAVIGEGRDELRMCIDENVNEMASALGVVVKNVAVPNVIISDDVRSGLDAIVQSRLAAQKAEQDLKTAEAEGKAKVALSEADVKAEQAKVLEQAKQKTTLAALEVERLKAEQNQIKIQIENEQLLIELADLKAQEAYLQAQTNLASELVLADTFSENPELYLYKMALANASALTETDKIIFTEEGNMPNIIFSSSGILPTVPTDGTSTSP